MRGWLWVASSSWGHGTNHCSSPMVLGQLLSRDTWRRKRPVLRSRIHKNKRNRRDLGQ